MKSHSILIYARTAIVATTILAATACAHGRNDYYGPAPNHSPYMAYDDYWYYPAIDSYYDTRSRAYFYIEHDRWIRARDLPPHLRSHPGRHVTIRSPHDRPYEEHRRHREQYAPERYRRAVPGDRGKDIRLGAPHRELPQRHRHERSRDDDGRDRNRRDAARERNGDRKLGPRQSDSRKQRQEYQRDPPATRRREAPDRRKHPTAATPAKHKEKAREREARKEKTHTGDRNPQGRPQDKSRRDDQPNPDPRPGRPGVDRSYWGDAATNL